MVHGATCSPARVFRAMSPSPEAALSRKALLVTFAAFYAAALLAGCAQTPGPGLARGEQIFDNCNPCHGKDGLGNATLGAPAIAGLPRWYVERQLQHFMTSVRGAHPQDMEGARMRPMARTLYRAGDVASVAQYVATLPARVPPASMAMGDTAAGRVKFQSVCITCHQADGGGNEALGAPPLKHQHDWYMMTQLYKFRSGIRGAHPDDTMGAQMAAMSQTLEDSTAMHDVIAYIRTLQK
jgi:cytochrome c553